MIPSPPEGARVRVRGAFDTISTLINNPG